eukprot:TRINITY_DN38330_c0_g1_i2.p1 TRINITY_DN38330_c0_g1~~TRINITY_DN38330_c0_g1_i2.p1  ORF type:complete len:173 (-),score=30.58 TRINITY_DN38330_c0_g1_i2:62-580(-)
MAAMDAQLQERPDAWRGEYESAKTRAPGWLQDRTDVLGEFQLKRWGYCPPELSVCSRCSSTLDFAKVTDAKITCKFCGFVQKFDENEDIQAGHAVMVCNEHPPWWREEDALMKRAEAGVAQEEAQNYPEIAMECPGCGNDKLQFWTRQLRSADEGQTTYFLCKKCGWRATEN